MSKNRVLDALYDKFKLILVGCAFKYVFVYTLALSLEILF